MKKWKKILAGIMTACLLVASAAGCGMLSSKEGPAPAAEQTKEETALFFLNKEGDSLVRREYSFNEPDRDARILEMMAMLLQDPPVQELQPLLPEETTFGEYSFADGVLSIDLIGGIGASSSPTSILVVGGLVRSFIQIDGVEGVCLTADGSPLKDFYGKEIGVLTADSFVENAGKSINSYQNAVMTLYFTDQTGTYLVSERRNVYYSSNEPLEMAVLEELVKGPREDGHYPIFTADTNITSVINQKDVCYVNFGKAIDATSLLSVSAEIPIYAVVDSLARTCGTEKVQFSINGESDILFRNKMDLKQSYEAKYDLLLR